MKQLEYDIRLSATIRALRELRRIKQHVIADVLNISQSSYCRIEKGEILLSPGQVKIIAGELNVSTLQIYAITEADELVNMSSTPLSDILISFVNLIEGSESDSSINAEELNMIIEKIRTRFDSR